MSDRVRLLELILQKEQRELANSNSNSLYQGDDDD